MFIFPMISCLAIFLVDDAEWQPYSSEKGKFTVSFPGKPTEKIAGIKGQMCQVVAAEDPVVLTKYVVYYFPSPWEGEMGKEKLRDKLFEEAGKSLALKGLQGKGKKVSLQGYEGREFQVEGTLRIRMYLTPKSIFVVVAHGALRLPKEDVEKFFASFRFQMTCKEAVRRQRLEEGGGNAQSEAAVAAGLKWLASHQAQDGRWSLDQFHETAKCTCQGAGQADDVAGTAFAVLPFLGAGHFLETGLEYKENEKPLYAKNVERALKYLLARQDRNGKIGRSIQSHSLATMVLCEAYGLTKDPNWKEPAQRALDWLVSAQQSGGWKDEEAQNADLVLVFWSLMAIRNGQIAGLNVPTKSLMDINEFLDSRASPDGSRYGRFARPEAQSHDHPPEVTTAAGLLCRMYLGWGPRNPGLLKGLEVLNKTKPSAKTKDMLYYYMATQVFFHIYYKSWEDWNPLMRELLIASQDKGDDPKTAHQKGSWSPAGDPNGNQGGRVMMTSLAILTLEVYYRHLPLYRRVITFDGIDP